MVLDAERFDRAVGIELVRIHEDGATMRLEVGQRHLNSDGVVHGGVIFTLADSALGYGIFRAVGRACTTAEMKMNFLRPVTSGVLVARSRILRAGKSLVVARADVHLGEAHIAHAQTTFAILG